MPQLEDLLITMADGQEELDIPEDAVSAIAPPMDLDKLIAEAIPSQPYNPLETQDTIQALLNIQRSEAGYSVPTESINPVNSVGLTADQYYDPRTYGFKMATPAEQKMKEALGSLAPSSLANLSTPLSPTSPSTRTISIQGDPNNTSFQGLGKYTSPEEFLRKDPAGFQATNPGLYNQMMKNQEAKAKLAVLGTESSTRMMVSLEKQMADIAAEKDPIKKESMLTALRGSVAESGAQLTKDTRMAAESQSGLEALRKKVAENEALDKADPSYAKHMTDSKATIAAKKELLTAMTRSQALANQMVKENPLIAGLAARVDTFVKTHESLVAKDMDRSDRRQELIEQVALTISPEATKTLSYLYPQIGNDPVKAAEFKMGLAKDPNKAALAFVFDPGFREEHLIPEALKGNRSAAEVAAKIHSQRTKSDETQAFKDLAQMRRFVSDEKFFEQEIQKMPGGKKLLSEYTQSKLMGKSKEADAQRTAQRSALAADWFVINKSMEYTGDVDNWTKPFIATEPELAATIDRLKTVNNGKPVSTSELLSAYVAKAPSRQQSIVNAEKLKHMLSQSLTEQEKGIYKSLDRKLILDNFNAKMASSVVRESYSAHLQSGLNWGL